MRSPRYLANSPLRRCSSLPGEYPYVRGTRTDNDWLIRQEVLAETPAEANAIAKDIITKGINSLGFNVEVKSVDDLKTLLDGIDLKAIEVNFKCCPRHAVELAKALAAYLNDNGAADTFRGSIAIRHPKSLHNRVLGICRRRRCRT